MSAPTPEGPRPVCAPGAGALDDEDARQVDMYAEFLRLAPELGQEEAYKRAYREELW